MTLKIDYYYYYYYKQVYIKNVWRHYKMSIDKIQMKCKDNLEALIDNSQLRYQKNWYT